MRLGPIRPGLLQPISHKRGSKASCSARVVRASDFDVRSGSARQPRDRNDWKHETQTSSTTAVKQRVYLSYNRPEAGRTAAAFERAGGGATGVSQDRMAQVAPAKEQDLDSKGQVQTEAATPAGKSWVAAHPWLFGLSLLLAACVVAAAVVVPVCVVKGLCSSKDSGDTSQASGSNLDLSTYPPDLRAKALSLLETLSDAPAGFGPPCSDRASWTAMVPASSSTARSLISRATAATLPPFSDDAYLAYLRNGSRASDATTTNRIAYIALLALAECVQWQGNFLPQLNDGLLQIAAQKSWAYSAHDGSLTYFNGTAYFVELSSSAYAAELAQVLYALGPLIQDTTRAAVMQALETRVFSPMRAAYNNTKAALALAWWLKPQFNNWNAVCLGGLTPAALSVLQDKNDRALFAAGDLLRSQFFTTFTADGYDTEGVGYFGYAVSNAIRSRQIILQHTGGSVDPFNNNTVAKALLYALEFPMSSSSPPCGLCLDANANFGDDEATFPASVVQYIQSVFLASSSPISNTIISGISGQTMTWFLNTVRLSLPGIQSQGTSALRKYFTVQGILTCRPDTLNSGRGIALTAKTLGNSFSHSHNDIGSYAISLNGLVLTGDPGSPGQYDANSFSALRYTQPIFNSYGHPVPRVSLQNQSDAGAQAQRPGAVLPSVISTSFTDAADSLVMNLTAAYNVSQLQLLQRNITYVRSPLQYVIIQDSVLLSSPGVFETALVTLYNWTVAGPNSGCFQKSPSNTKLCANITSSQPFTMSSELIVVASNPSKKFTRIALRLNSLATAAWIQVLFFDAANPP